MSDKDFDKLVELLKAALQSPILVSRLDRLLTVSEREVLYQMALPF